MSEFVYPFRSKSGYGTGPGDEQAIEALSRAVQRVDIVLHQPRNEYHTPNQSLEGNQISTDVLLNLDDWR